MSPGERGLRLNAESALLYASALMPREEASLAGPAYVCARWRVLVRKQGLAKAGGVEGYVYVRDIRGLHSWTSFGYFPANAICYSLMLRDLLS